jgi:Domain of unknown function (DUF4913)
MTRPVQRTVADELLDLIERRVATLEDQIAHGSSAASQPLETLYANAEEWVRDWLLVNVERPFGRANSGWYWCAQWWKHNEAVLRLTALWFSWENARVDQGMERWLRLLDQHLPILCGHDGPFRSCSPGDKNAKPTHHVDDYPPVAPAPEGWFDWWSDTVDAD